MENNKRVVLTLALVAVIAVAAIGIGYAYTASTTNSGNSSDTAYITVTPSKSDASPSYSEIFNGTHLNFDTNSWYDTSVNPAVEKVTYTLEANQLIGIDGAKEYADSGNPDTFNDKVVKLGDSLFIEINEVKTTTPFLLLMSHIAGTISSDYDFVVGYKIATTRAGLDTATTYVVTYNASTGCEIKCPGIESTLKEDGDGNRFNNTVKFVEISLYVKDTAAKVLAKDASLPQPLENVTFKFTATDVKPAVGHILQLTVGNNGEIVLPENVVSTQTFYDDIELTIKPADDYEIDKFIVNGVDAKESISEGKYTANTKDKDIVISVTFKTI